MINHLQEVSWFHENYVMFFLCPITINGITLTICADIAIGICIIFEGIAIAFKSMLLSLTQSIKLVELLRLIEYNMFFG